MFDKEAIHALQSSAAIMQANASIEEASKRLNCSVTPLPNEFTLHDLEKYLPNRRRARGTMETNTLQAFASYTTEHAEEGATVFVDQESMKATAVLNLGTPSQPGHADNRAVLAAKRTAAYAALTSIANGTGQKQATVAEFLEDWTHHITCHNDAGSIENPKATAAVRKLTIEAMRRLESSEQQLSATRSALESVAASSTEPLPTHIYFKCQPYTDLPERTFIMRLGIVTTGDKPAITLRVIKAEQHQEEMARQLAELVTTSFAGPADQRPTVVLGTYTTRT